MTLKHWDEDPVGEWSIEVSDSGHDEPIGSFRAWSMTFWGSSLDPSKARPWTLEDTADSGVGEQPFPTTTTPAATTKVLAKPTDALQPGHAEEPGEAHKPAFDVDVAKPPATSADAPAAPAQAGHASFWAIVAVIFVCILTSAAYIYRRRKSKAGFMPVALEEGHPMMQRGGRRRDDESDDSDDEDPQERAALRPPADDVRGLKSLDFHSGFLDESTPAPGDPPPAHS